MAADDGKQTLDVAIRTPNKKERYPESLDHITPADRYFGRYPAIMDRRAIIKYETLQRKRKEYPRPYVNQ